MKALLSTFFLLMAYLAFAQSLPVITASPTNTTVYPGSTATFNVTATGAMGYQWRFNNADIPGGTNATLQISNAQSTNCGYYLVLVKNAAGWTPSQIAYLFLDYTSGGITPTAGGLLPFSNTNNTGDRGSIICLNNFGSGSPNPTNGYVQIVAGPELDEMFPVGNVLRVRSFPSSNKYTNGYFNTTSPLISNIKPGQTIYYSVVATYTNAGVTTYQPSTIMPMVAGTNGFPAPSTSGLKFPYWIEWPNDPWTSYPTSNPNQVRVVGETFTLICSYGADTDLGLPYFQWRKNGTLVGDRQYLIPDPYYGGYGSRTVTLTISNAQPSDAGVYDVDVRGNNWFIGQKIYVSIQTSNGPGVLQKPKLIGSNLTCDVVGAIGRNYKIQWSTNLSGWNDLTTLSNITGTVTFTNAPGNDRTRFYRTVLLP